MEKQTLPNSALILILGIFSIITCCCWGIIGLIFGIVTIVLAKTATQTYISNPELYTGYGNVKAGKIMGIIGIILSLLYIITIIVFYIIYGMDGYYELQEEMMRTYGEMN